MSHEPSKGPKSKRWQEEIHRARQLTREIGTQTNAVNITDPVSLLSFLFADGLAPVEPFPDCGPGMLPADAVLGCANPPDCQ